VYLYKDQRQPAGPHVHVSLQIRYHFETSSEKQSIFVLNDILAF